MKPKEIKRKLKSIIKTAKRNDMMAQGAYDGRFKEKVIPNKKGYKRSKKHKSLDI